MLGVDIGFGLWNLVPDPLNGTFSSWLAGQCSAPDLGPPAPPPPPRRRRRRWSTLTVLSVCISLYVSVYLLRALIPANCEIIAIYMLINSSIHCVWWSGNWEFLVKLVVLIIDRYVHCGIIWVFVWMLSLGMLLFVSSAVIFLG